MTERAGRPATIRPPPFQAIAAFDAAVKLLGAQLARERPGRTADADAKTARAEAQIWPKPWRSSSARAGGAARLIGSLCSRETQVIAHQDNPVGLVLQAGSLADGHPDSTIADEPRNARLLAVVTDDPALCAALVHLSA
jgi:hypothetical protein